MGSKGKISIDQCKKLIYIISFVCLTSFLTAGTYAYSESDVVNEIKQTLKQFYVEDLPDSVYSKTSVNDIIKEINIVDPYTKYYSALKYKEVVKSIDNETSGLGIYIEMNSEGAKVMSMNTLTPERDAGIIVGDIIVMADGHLLVGATKDAALRYIKGNDSGIVTLKIKRGTNLMTVDVNRQHTANYAIETQILDNHIGYIKINSFSKYGDAQFSYIINSYQKKKIDRYIIDLRFNQGGFLTTATDIAGYFIGANVALISKSKLTSEKKWYGKFHGSIINKPIIFLVNKYSASAAEMLTAAVKDYKKAYIIGTKTYGKGSIQWAKKLSNDDFLKLTIERFYSPKGNPIDNVGVIPDLVLDDNTDGLKIAELLMNSQQQLSDTNGCIRICYDNKIVVLKASKAISQEYWQAYGRLLQEAEKNGSVAFWTNGDWKVVDSENLGNFEALYFHNYDVRAEMTDLMINKGIGIHFKTKIIERSINSKNIELIDSLSGERVKVNFVTDNDNGINVEPVNDLNRDYTYYLVVHPGLLKADNSAIGKGFVVKVRTNS